MHTLDKDIIDSIRNSVNIVDVISGYIPLTRRGKNFFGVCPFHDDHSPSMSVSESKQIYRCFSCGATGNVYTFVMNYENITFIEAVKILADKAGIDVDIGQVSIPQKISSPLYDIYELAEKFYSNNLNAVDGKQAKDYLQKREITEDIIKEFGIGLSLKKYDMLTNLFNKKGYSLDEQIKSGLVTKNNFGYNDIYYNRIMFPLWDLYGKVVGFSGRIYDKKDPSKYINTKETEIFKKGELIYNYHRAKDECRLKHTVIVMEGFMDVIRAYSVGIKNVIATMGTAVTKEQAMLIKKMAKDVILCFDGDEAGAKATIACSDELAKIGVVPKVIRLEDDLDPDDYIKTKGMEQFLRKIDNPINIIDFKLSFFKNKQNLSDSQELAKYLNKMIDELAKIDDEVLREITINKLSIEANLDPIILKNKLLLKNGETQKETPKKTESILQKDKYTKAEQYLLYYMLLNKDIIKMYNRESSFLPTERYRLLAKEISYFYKINNYFEIADFITFLDNNKMLLDALGEIEILDLKEEYSQEEINDYLNTIDEYNIKYELNRLQNKSRSETDLTKKAEIVQKMVELRRRETNDKRN